MMQATQQSPPSKLHPALLTSSLQTPSSINSNGPGQSENIFFVIKTFLQKVSRYEIAVFFERQKNASKFPPARYCGTVSDITLTLSTF